MRKLVLAGLFVSLAAGAAAQSAKAPPQRTNVTGPTVEQIRGAARDAIEGKPGPVKPMANGGFKYDLPDDVRVMFVRCATDRRCDRAVLIAPLGPDGPAERAAAENSTYAHNLIYGDRTRGAKSYYATVAAGPVDDIRGISLIRDYQLTSTTAANEIHSDLRIFYDMLLDARKALAKAGRPK